MVRAIALSQSLATLNTHELLRVVTRVAAGVPGSAFVATVAPIAAEPLLPDVSAPLNAITVIEEATLWDSAALTVTEDKGLVAWARQISAVPSCLLLRCTRDHVSPPPLIPVTTVLGLVTPSLATKASSSSFVPEVEKGAVEATEDGEELSPNDFTSMLKPVVCASAV